MSRGARSFRWWVTASAAAVLAVPSLLVASPAVGDDIGQPVKILIVGDSITQGSSGDWTWRYRLAKALDVAGCSYDFVGPRDGVHSLTTGANDAQEYQDPNFDQDHFSLWGGTFHYVDDDYATTTENSIGWAVSEYQPDVVVEALGVNDLAYWTDADDTLAMAQRFVEQVQAADPDTAVVMSTVPNSWVSGVADYNADLLATAPSWSTDTSRVVTADPAADWVGGVTDTWTTRIPMRRARWRSRPPSRTASARSVCAHPRLARSQKSHSALVSRRLSRFVRVMVRRY